MTCTRASSASGITLTVLAIADTAKSVMPVGVQLVKYTLRPLHGAGGPALGTWRRRHFMPGAVMRSGHVLSPYRRAGLIAGV